MDTIDNTPVDLGESYGDDCAIASVNGYAVTNQGVGGNQFFQMLGRFQKKVIDLRRNVIVIERFHNDIFRDSPAQLKSAKERIKFRSEEIANLFDIKNVNQSVSSHSHQKLLCGNQQRINSITVNNIGKALTPFQLTG